MWSQNMWMEFGTDDHHRYMMYTWCWVDHNTQHNMDDNVSIGCVRWTVQVDMLTHMHHQPWSSHQRTYDSWHCPDQCIHHSSHHTQSWQPQYQTALMLWPHHHQCQWSLCMCHQVLLHQCQTTMCHWLDMTMFTHQMAVQPQWLWVFDVRNQDRYHVSKMWAHMETSVTQWTSHNEEQMEECWSSSKWW